MLINLLSNRKERRGREREKKRERNYYPQKVLKTNSRFISQQTANISTTLKHVALC